MYRRRVLLFRLCIRSLNIRNEQKQTFCIRQMYIMYKHKVAIAPGFMRSCDSMLQAGWP